jgi:hypothetical protein
MTSPESKEEQRLHRLDGLLEVERFLEAFLRPHQLEQAHRVIRGRSEERERLQPQPIHQRFLPERDQFAHRANAPLVQDQLDITRRLQRRDRQRRDERAGVADDFRRVSRDARRRPDAHARTQVQSHDRFAQSRRPRRNLRRVRVLQDREPAQIERADAGRGGLDVGREAVGGLQHGLRGGGFLLQ